MTEPTRVDFDSAGGVTVAAYRWDPSGKPIAIAQLEHGMGEYALRYQPLVDDLLAAGYVVYAHDHRGHGDTAAGPDAYGVLGPGGWDELVADIGRMAGVAQDAHPGLPHALIAHSMGSFAAQQWLLDNSGQTSAVVLSGTAAIDLMEPALDLDQPMDLAGFNAPFAPARTDFDWLSRDEAQVDAYIASERCGFGLDAIGGKEMFISGRRVADPEHVGHMRHDLPVYVVVGEADPVNGGMVLAEALVTRYEQAGLENVTLVSYPDARHEVFNETNRDEVVAGVLAWLSRTLAR